MLASTTFATPFTALGGVIPYISFIFLEFLCEELLGTNLSGGKVSIPSSPFSVLLAGGDVPSPVFSNSSPFGDPSLGLIDQVGDDTFVAHSSPPPLPSPSPKFPA